MFATSYILHYISERNIALLTIHFTPQAVRVSSSIKKTFKNVSHCLILIIIQTMGHNDIPKITVFNQRLEKIPVHEHKFGLQWHCD